MTSDPIGNTHRRSRWTGNGWRQSTEVGQLRAAIYKTRRRLPNLADNSSREPQRRTAQGLKSRAGVDPFQSSGSTGLSPGSPRRGKQTRGNSFFGVINFQPRRHGRYGRGAYWGCCSSSKECRTTDKSCSGGLFLTVLSAFQRGCSKP